MSPASRRLRPREAALAAALVVTALSVRVPFLPYESWDFRVALSNWYDFIVANGYFHSWQYDFAIYNPPYLYLLTAVAWFAPFVPKLPAIKALSILGDFALALFAYRCVRLRYPGSRVVPLLAGGAVLLLPTVVLNSAWWGQADALYTWLLMGCLYGILAGRNAWACVAFGLAFSVKAQAAFLAPFLYWLRVKKAVSGRCFALIPAVFALALLPAALAGRSLTDLLSIYFAQASAYPGLARGAPNLYQWISNDHYPWWPVGLLLTAALVHGVRRLLEGSRLEMTRDAVVFLALYSALLTPFFLPKMLDRYFFPADVFAIVLAFYRPRLWYVPVVVVSASLSAYADSHSHLGLGVFPLGWSAVLLALLLLDLTRRLFVELDIRVKVRAATQVLWRRIRRRRAAAAPLFALSLAFAALFGVFAAEGSLRRPLANDGAAAQTLARVAARPSESGFYVLGPWEGLIPLPEDSILPPGLGLHAVRPTVDAAGQVIYEIAPRRSALFDLVLGAALRYFGDDLTAQVVAARLVMLAFFCGAALFAYLSLCRALAFLRPALRGRGRWIALAATLFAFGSAAAGADTVAAAAAPEAFGIFLMFHGILVFLRERRFAQLLAKSAAALLLGAAGYALLAPFVVLGLLGRWRRRAGRLAAAGRGRAILRPLPEGSVRGPIGNPFLALGAFCVVFGAAATAVGAVGPSGPSGGRELLRGSIGEVGNGPRWEQGMEAFRRIGTGVVPSALFGGGAPAGKQGRAASLAGVVIAAAGLAGAVSLRSFALLALALSSLGWTLESVREGAPEVAAPTSLGLLLVTFAAGLVLLRRSWGAGATFAAGVAALGFTVGGGGGLGGLLRGDPVPARAPALEEPAANARLRRDFEKIRQVLRVRPRRTVFLAPPPAGGGAPSGARVEYLLGEAVPIRAPARRAFAEFLLAVGPETDRGPGNSSGNPHPALLTPDNEVAFLYHRAAYDGDLDDWIAEAGPPRARSEFDIHLAGGRLLFVKDDCRPEHFEGTVLVHLTPEDPDDLPPHRKPYGFDNRTFNFANRAFERGERCVAGIPFPEYPIRSVVVGSLFRNRDAPSERGWRAEFTP